MVISSMQHDHNDHSQIAKVPGLSIFQSITYHPTGLSDKIFDKNLFYCKEFMKAWPQVDDS